MTLVRHPAEVVRLCIYLAVFATALVVPDGWTCQAISAVAIVVSLALQVARKPPFIRLSMIWEIGFLAIVSIEALTSADDYAREVGLFEYNWACRYLVAANAVVLLAHGVTFSERGFRTREWIQQHHVNRRAPFVLIVATYAFYLAYSVPFAISLATSGRVGTWTFAEFEAQSVIRVVTSALTLVSGMLLPPMMAYYVLWVARKPLWIAILPSLPIFGLQLVMGTRFHFLFPSIGLAVMSLSASSFSIKAVARLAAFGIAALVLSVMMLRVRDAGIAAASWETFTTSVKMDELPSHEGTVETMTMLVQYFDTHDYMYGLSNRAILLFWIPRSFWPDKPTLLGYWFVRAYGMRGVGDIHNVAGSFAADGYADFGFLGGILFCGLIGFGFGRVERWTARVIATQGHPLLVVACTLYGATFFAIRSLDTTIISLSGVVLFGLLFARVVAPQQVRGSFQHGHVASYS